MKFHEISKAVAASCDLEAAVVAAVQERTFREIKMAAENGGRVPVPDFGVFLARQSDGHATLKLKPEQSEAGGGASAKKKAGNPKKAGRAASENSDSRAAKKAARKASRAGNDDGWGTADDGPESGER